MPDVSLVPEWAWVLAALGILVTIAGAVGTVALGLMGKAASAWALRVESDISQGQELRSKVTEELALIRLERSELERKINACDQRTRVSSEEIIALKVQLAAVQAKLELIESFLDKGRGSYTGTP